MKVTQRPVAIMINVPEAFFKHDGKISGDREEAFCRFYEGMGHRAEEDCFYHFISTCPVHQVEHVYVCFRGQIRYKAICVQYLKNKPVMLAHYEHPEPRDWCITTGPVIKPPRPMQQKGFRGFKYVYEDLF